MHRGEQAGPGVQVEHRLTRPRRELAQHHGDEGLGGRRVHLPEAARRHLELRRDPVGAGDRMMQPVGSFEQAQRLALAAIPAMADGPLLRRAGRPDQER